MNKILNEEEEEEEEEDRGPEGEKRRKRSTKASFLRTKILAQDTD